MAKKNGYDLSRDWFNFAFEKEDAKVIHTAIYMWILELNNRLGWKQEFGLPTQDTMEGLSIGNKMTYLSAIKDLTEWKFIEIVKESKNQYQSMIIKLCHSNNATARGTALDTALQRHDIQHCNGTSYGIGISTGISIAPIDKPQTKKPRNHKPINQQPELVLPFSSPDFLNAWNDFIISRNQMKPKPTAKAIELALNKLTPWGESKAIVALKEAAERGWKSVFEPDEKKMAERGVPLKNEYSHLKGYNAAKHKDTDNYTFRISPGGGAIDYFQK